MARRVPSVPVNHVLTICIHLYKSQTTIQDSDGSRDHFLIGGAPPRDHFLMALFIVITF